MEHGFLDVGAIEMGLSMGLFKELAEDIAGKWRNPYKIQILVVKAWTVMNGDKRRGSVPYMLGIRGSQRMSWKPSWTALIESRSTFFSVGNMIEQFP